MLSSALERPTLAELLERGIYTIPVPDGGWYLNRLGRSASYAAAARGELPVLRVGNRELVIVARLMELLGLPVPGNEERSAATPSVLLDHHGGPRDDAQS